MRKPRVIVSLALAAALLLSVFIEAQLRSKPAETAQSFASVQFFRSESGWWFFDSRTGDIWIYDEQRKLPLSHFRLRELGAPLERVHARPEGTQAEAPPKP